MRFEDMFEQLLKYEVFNCCCYESNCNFIKSTYTEAKVAEWCLKLKRSLGQALHLVTEALEASLELVPQLPLGLLGSQVITIMHVLMLAQICRDLSNLHK